MDVDRMGRADVQDSARHASDGPSETLTNRTTETKRFRQANVDDQLGPPSTPRSSSQKISSDEDKLRTTPTSTSLLQDSFKSLWHTLYAKVDWILPVFKNWSKLKLVLRSALTAWLCMLCMLISPIEIALGTASFLILVGVFISPNEVPILAIVEREFFTLLLTTAAWAYANLAIFFAHLARRNRLSPSETVQETVYTGGYIEAGPTAICAAFLAVGVAFFLYLKVKFGPSPFLFASILACIALDITLVYAPLYPYPFYVLGQAIVIPLALKAAISITVSCLFYPKSVNSNFVEKFISILEPLGSSASQMLDLLKSSPTDPNFDFDMMHNQVMKAEAGLLPLRTSSKLLTREISFSLANGEDLKSLIQVFVGILAPADGISYYFATIKSDMQGMDIHYHTHVSRFNTPIPTRPATPTPQQTTASTPVIENQHLEVGEKADEGLSSALSSHAASRLRKSNGPRSNSPASLPQQRHSHELRHRMQNALHRWSRRPSHNEQVEVGLWESLRYAAVESQLHTRENDRYTEMCFEMLCRASNNLVQEQVEAYNSIKHWLSKLNKQRYKQLRNALTFTSTKDIRMESAQTMEKGGVPKSLRQSANDLQKAIDEFHVLKRRVTEPFRNSVSEAKEGDDSGAERIPHRYLFQCFTFCYFEVQYSTRILTFLQACADIEAKRTHWQFWLPARPKIFTLQDWKWSEESGQDDIGEHDEDPDEIPGMVSSLGKTKARDPEVMDRYSTNRGQKMGIALSRFAGQIFKGNSLFMIKAGAVTVLVSLPLLLKSSAGWSYHNKAIWTVIMSQLSIARHRGEVLFSLASRVMATLMGAIIGMVVWYIASGNGVANPYAMAVVTAFAFILLMTIRLNMPGPPITSIITCVTAALVIGYSWKDSHNPTYGSPGIGWAITWRRFLEVVIGSTAAYIMAILPPSSSMRKYFRLSHATTIGEIGGMYCQVITLGVRPNSIETKEAIQHLIAIRSKIRRLMLLKTNISYEWSFRGQWPLKRYEELEQVELQLSKLLSHAITICESIGPTYSRALLRRTHFLDPIFLADCVAILTMCATSLRTSRPLPQIVPVLIDRYLSNTAGFQYYSRHYHHNHQQYRYSNHQHDRQDALQNDDDDDDRLHGFSDEDCFADLPKVVTYETICKDEYQIFAVGVYVAYGIVVRLDRLCMAVKELVGETYSVPTDLHLGGT